MFMKDLHAEYHIPVSTVSLVATIQQKTKYIK
jgi:hypothetical protein